MSKIIAVAGRDLKAWLNTFSFYILAAFFFSVTGYFFWSGINYFSLVSFQVATNPSLKVRGLNLTEGVLSVFLQNMALILLHRPGPAAQSSPLPSDRRRRRGPSVRRVSGMPGTLPRHTLQSKKKKPGSFWLPGFV